ncbi:MAG: PAS domain S-box protein, partial [Bacteroidia bacterium]
FILLVIEVTGIYILSNLNQQNENLILDETNNQIKSSYAAMINSYRLLTESIYENEINQPHILKLYKQANGADSLKKQQIRDSLFNYLSNTYNYLKTKNIRQLHFHLPDNKSFLRFHRPFKNGDDLTKVRTSVKLTNQLKKPHFGFEEGRIYNGYRNVFPLIYKGKHLGSVEISFTFSAISAYLSGQNTFCNLYINKSVYQKKVFESEKINYSPSKNFENLVYEKCFVYNQKDSVLHFSIIENNLDQINENFKRNETFSFIASVNNKSYTLTFLTINNLNQENVAYLTILKENKTLTELRVHYYIQLLLLTPLLFILFSIVYLYIQAKRRIAQKAKILLESENRFKIIFKKDRNIKLMIDPESGKILDFNAAAESFYGYSNLGNMYIHEINQESKNDIIREMQYAVENQKNHFNFVHKLKNGVLKNVEVHSSSINLKQKTVLFSIIHDVTEKVKAQNALIESEKKYKSIINKLNDIYYRVDTEGNLEFVSPSGVNQLGYDSENELIGKNVAES